MTHEMLKSLVMRDMEPSFPVFNKRHHAICIKAEAEGTMPYAFYEKEERIERRRQRGAGVLASGWKAEVRT